MLVFHLVEKQNHEEGVKRKRGPAKSVCPYYKASALQQMRDDLLGTVHDIEQLLKLGRELHSCPYYSTRLAIPPAQVTPSSLLSSSIPMSHYYGDCFLAVLLTSLLVLLNMCCVVCLFCLHSWWCCPIRCCFMKLQERPQEFS